MPIAKLAQLRPHLNLTRAPSPTEEVEMYGKLNAATEIVEAFCGPVLPREVTEYVGWSSFVLLRHAPVLNLVSATGCSGSVLDTSRTRVTPAGVIETSGPYGLPALPGGAVTYRVGRDPIPVALVEACLIIASHLWATQRGTGGGMPGMGGEEETVAAGMGFAVPNRAMELMHCYLMPRLA